MNFKNKDIDQLEDSLVKTFNKHLPNYLGNKFKKSQVRREISVGNRFADVVIVVPIGKRKITDNKGFTTKECVVLSCIRKKGPLKINELKRHLGFNKNEEIVDLLKRLNKENLLHINRNEIVSIKNDFSRSHRVIAFEAKLRNWKEALIQAKTYLKFADQSNVVLPEKYSNPAIKAASHFLKNGIGLIIVSKMSMQQIIKPKLNADYDWRREFVVSRFSSNLN